MTDILSLDGCVTFNPTKYIIKENKGSVQVSLRLSNVASFDVPVYVYNVNVDATG